VGTGQGVAGVVGKGGRVLIAKRQIVLFFALLLVAALCPLAAAEEDDAYSFIEGYGKQFPVPSYFSICYAHGCNQSAEVRLTDEEWDTVRQAFRPDAADAETERRYLAKAVGSLETIVGRRTGTGADRGGTFAGVFRKYQMDCVDEAVNTTTYLVMLIHDGLIRFHELRGPAHRGYFLWGGWPHIAAVISEIDTGQEYAVDSWFLDNGHPPFIVPLGQWKEGWNPPPGTP
jgi:hypothetical protein